MVVHGDVLLIERDVYPDAPMLASYAVQRPYSKSFSSLPGG